MRVCACWVRIGNTDEMKSKEENFFVFSLIVSPSVAALVEKKNWIRLRHTFHTINLCNISLTFSLSFLLFLAFSTVLFFSLLFYAIIAKIQPLYETSTPSICCCPLWQDALSHIFFFSYKRKRQEWEEEWEEKAESRQHIVRKITWKGQKGVYGKQKAKVKLRLFLFLLVISVVSRAKHPAPLQPTKSNYCTSQAHISQFSTLLK